MVTGVEHRVQGVGHILLNAKCLRHIRRAVEEVLTQYHCDAVPGGTSTHVTAESRQGCRSHSDPGPGDLASWVSFVSQWSL